MLNYPLLLSFKVIAFNPQVKITDPANRVVLYVKQKALALKEAIKVFTDEQQKNLLYEIKADRIIDFSAKYTVTAPDGSVVGSIRRQGMKSLWKATYQIMDAGGTEVAVIQEENPMIKFLDALLSEFIPFINMFINPAYLVKVGDQTLMRLKKQAAFFEGKFQLTQEGAMTEAQERLLLPCVIMMVLLERMRG